MRHHAHVPGAKLLAAAVSVLLLVTASACGNGGSDTSDAADGGWTDMLTYVPLSDGEPPDSAIFVDFARLREAAPEGSLDLGELDRPFTDAAFYEYSLRLFQEAGLLFLDARQWYVQVGLANSLLDGDEPAWDLAAYAPFHLRTITLTGGIDPAEAIENPPVPGEFVEVESRGDAEVYMFEPDQETETMSPTHIYAGLDGEALHVSLHVSSDDLLTVIDAGEGEVDSLAGLEEYQLLASALDRDGAYVVSLSHGLPSLGYAEVLQVEWNNVDDILAGPDIEEGIGDQDERDAVKEALSSVPLLEPYSHFGAAIGEDGGGRFVVAAAVHDSGESARENESRLRERFESVEAPNGGPWDGVVGSFEASVDDRVLTAVLRPADADVGAGWTVVAPLFAFER